MEKYDDNNTVALVAAARESSDAFAELIARYMPMINKVIAGFDGFSSRYDEVYSEACVAFHRAVISYDISRSSDITFGLYARICVYRKLCDFSSKLSRESMLSDVDVESLVQDFNIEQRLVERERMKQYLERAQSVLSEYEYEVFNLYIGGYSSQEIADKLEKTTKSVENAKTRAFARLRGMQKIFSDIK